MVSIARCSWLKPAESCCWRTRSAHLWFRSTADSQSPDLSSDGEIRCALGIDPCVESPTCSRWPGSGSLPSYARSRCGGSSGSWPCTDCCSIGIDTSWCSNESSCDDSTQTAWSTWKGKGLMKLQDSINNQLTSYRTVRTSGSALDDDASSGAWVPAWRRRACRKRDTGCADFPCGWFDGLLSLNCCRMLEDKNRHIAARLETHSQTFIANDAHEVLLLSVSQHVLL